MRSRRCDMARSMASMEGAMAFQKGLGAMHSLSHPCGSVLDLHHGLTRRVEQAVLEIDRLLVVGLVDACEPHLGHLQ